MRIATQTPVSNPLLTTFWTMGAVRHGDYVAKVRVAPAAESAAHVIHSELDLNSGSDVFRATLVDELRARAFDFDLQVQLCTDLDAMPVNDTTVEWPEKLSPFVTVGRVRVPRQDISGSENFEQGRRARVQPVACHRRAQAARRDHAGATHLQRVSQGPPDAEPPAADRARRG